LRVTNNMLTNSFLSDMRNNLENMQRIQQQMTSGKLFSKPSDDPFKVARSMQLYSDISSNKQYNSNISDVTNWLDTTDAALDQGGKVLQRVRDLMISAGNGSYSPDERKKIKDEVNQLVGQFSQVLNTNFDGKYIFGGTRGTTKPTNTTAIYAVPSSTNKSNKAGGNASVSGKITTSDTAFVVKINSVAGDKANSVSMSVDGGNTFSSSIAPGADGKFDLGNGLKINIDNNSGNSSGDTYTFSLIENQNLVYYDKNGTELPTDSSASADQQTQFENISSKLKTEISQGVFVDYNVNAHDVINYGSNPGDDLRSLFNRIINHLDGNNDDGTTMDSDSVSKINGQDLTDIDAAINNLLKVRSEVGAKQNRMDSALSQNTQQNYSLTEILSKNEDIDITEKTMEYATMQTVYLASLQTSAKVLQPSLLDYLR